MSREARRSRGREGARARERFVVGGEAQPEKRRRGAPGEARGVRRIDECHERRYNAGVESSEYAEREA